MPSRPLARRVLARRALLAGGVGGLVGTAVAACAGASARTPSAQAVAAIVPPAAPSAAPSADESALERARAMAAALAAAADRLAAADPEHARLLREVAADHRAHLAALAAVVPGAPSPAPSRLAQGAQLPEDVAAERYAARTALDDVQLASPTVAALLARVGAARAAHADLLAAAAGMPAPGPLAAVGGGAAASEPAGAAALPSPTGAQPSVPDGLVPVPGTLELAAGARDALVALTAGEHAAVFAYGLIAARVSQGRRGQARAAWAWHLARRDLLEERLLAAGVQPPAAAPAYDLGGAPNASRLAATVERRLGVLAVRAVAATEGDDRRAAAAGLVEGARRLAAWTGRPETLPG